MTKEELNKMEKTQNVKDYKVYAVIDGKGKYIDIGDLRLVVGGDDSLPLKDILIGYTNEIKRINDNINTLKEKNSKIFGRLVKEIQNIKKEVGL